MKHLSLIFIITIHCCLYAQMPKGAVPIPQSPIVNPKSSITRAVVVGISDYQHKTIPDLQFADRDAEAFANFLRSPAGESLDNDRLQVLTNEKATAGQVVAALDGLVETCAEGETVILYFSGHGDIEKVTIRQNGYLLCHDSPATGYPAGGTLSLGYLQDIVSTIAEKKCRIVLITDACHAGKLAGSAYNGTQTTNAALSRQFANEIKIMSCQANELALEGGQWDEGRGLFSFHLIEGLTGFADKNADSTVSLLEIGRYLEDHVTAEAAPHAQTPVVLGDRNFPLARVDAAFFADLQNRKSADKMAFQKTEMRGFLTTADSATYAQFQAAIGRHDFLPPSDSCADVFYRKLAESPTFRSFHGLMRRNYAAALQDEIQQAINALLDNDPYENNNWKYNSDKYAQYPAYLARAIELLGEEHYIASSLRAKKAYFEGYLLARTAVGQETNPERRDSLREAAKRKYLEAISHDHDAPYPYFAIGSLYHLILPLRTDSLELWCRRAIEHAPGWVTPMLEIYSQYRNAQTRLDIAEKWLFEAEKILPNSLLILERKVGLRAGQGRRDEVVELCEKMIAQKPDLFNGYAALAYALYLLDGDFPEAEKQARKAIELNPSLNNRAYDYVGLTMLKMRRTQEAIAFLENSLQTKDILARGTRMAALVEAYGQNREFERAAAYARQILEENLGQYAQTHAPLNLGKIRVRQNRLAEAALLFEQSLTADPAPNSSFVLDWAWLGEVARLEGRSAVAEGYFQKALTYTCGSALWEIGFKEEVHYLYGNFLLRENRLDEARAQFQKSMDLRKKGFWGEYGFALLAARAGEKQKALDWLEKSIDNFYPDAESILAEPFFEKIRRGKRFEALMKNHFPEQAKD